VGSTRGAAFPLGLQLYFGASGCLFPPFANCLLTNELVALAGFAFAPYFEGNKDRKSPPLAANPNNAKFTTHTMSSLSKPNNGGKASVIILCNECGTGKGFPIALKIP